MGFDYSNLNHLQLGKYGEYFAKMEFTKAGFDVYTAEVDDKGIDFIIRKDESQHYDIQVKSIRNNNYVFMRKDKFKPRRNLFLALVIFTKDNAPNLLLIPSLHWKKRKYPALTERSFIGKKSKPEWGVNLNKKNIKELVGRYEFYSQAGRL